MEVSRPWSQLIFSGIKKLEMRKNNPDNWGRVVTGNRLVIVDRESLERRAFLVVEARQYATFEEAILAEGVRNLLPGRSTMEEAEHIYFGFDGPDGIEVRRQEFKEFGAIVFELVAYENISQ